MGRPQKLSDEQRAAVKRRLIAGERPTDLARELKVSKALISGINKQSEQIKDVARQVVTADGALRELPVSDQLIAVTLIDDLRSIMSHMATGARHAAEMFSSTYGAARIMAKPVIDKVAKGAALTDKGRNTLRDAAALQKMANDAAVVPVSLMTVQRDQVKRLGETPDPGAPDLSTLSTEEVKLLESIMGKATSPR